VTPSLARGQKLDGDVTPSLARGHSRFIMGRGVGPACVALALASGVPGCSRTGLDDVALRPEPTGSPSPDGSSSGDDAPSSGSEGGEFFGKGDADDASELAGDGADGQSLLETCAATCAGCCTAAGACLSGIDTTECGNGGQECMECQPELACSPAGVCQ